jgi:hypothetical protein
MHAGSQASIAIETSPRFSSGKSQEPLSIANKARRLFTLPRFQLFEFCDQAWLHGIWREAYMDGLNSLFKLGGVYKTICRPYCRWAGLSGGRSVLDLASGGAGEIETLVQSANAGSSPLPKITVSDLYPDFDAFKRLKARFPDQVDFVQTPVDAANTSGRMESLLSISAGFHHFNPEQARKVLANAMQQSNGLFIVEVFDRSVLSALLCLLNLLPLMLCPLFSKRFSLNKVLITTVLPIIPLMIVFDGVVSAFRTYRPEEILAMLPPERRHEWHWESGAETYLGVVSAPWIFGFKKPKNPQKRCDHSIEEARPSRVGSLRK